MRRLLGGLIALVVVAGLPATAATFQVLCSVRSLEGFDDLRDHVARHPSAGAARALFPDYRGAVPRFLPADWLSGLAPGGGGQARQR